MFADEVAEAFDRAVLVAVELQHLLLAARRVKNRAVQNNEVGRGSWLLPHDLQVRGVRSHDVVLQQQ